MKKKSEPIVGYTWRDLAEKTEWEGGVNEMYCGYLSIDRIIDPELKRLATTYNKAHDALVEYLREKGGLLE